MRLTQREIANHTGLSQGYLSDVFSGRKRPGIGGAKRFSAITGRDWTDYLKMRGPEIEADLRRALEHENATKEA